MMNVDTYICLTKLYTIHHRVGLILCHSLIGLKGLQFKNIFRHREEENLHWAASTDICSSPPCGPEWAELSTATHHLGNDSQQGLALFMFATCYPMVPAPRGTLRAWAQGQTSGLLRASMPHPRQMTTPHGSTQPLVHYFPHIREMQTCVYMSCP